MKKILLTFLACATINVYAATPASQLADLLRQTKSVKADFQQTVYDAQHNPMSRSTGYFILQKPNKFYWLIKKPLKQIIINDGTRLWNYQPDLQQVVVQPISKSLNATPLAILSGSTQALQQGFKIKKLTDDEYQLTAKKSGNFSVVVLHFDGSDIESMQLRDQLGQQTKLLFSKVERNFNVNPAIFHFKTPHGVDVVSSM